MQLEPKPPKSKRPDMVSRRHSAIIVSAKEGPEAKKTIARRSSAVLSDLQIKSGQRRMSLSTWSPNASQETDGSGSPSSHSPVMQRKSMKRRASVSAIASVRRASFSGSAADTISQARMAVRRMSHGEAHEVGGVRSDRGSVTEQRRLSLKRAATTPMTAQPEIVNLAPSEALTGVQVRKPSDRAKAEERDRQKAAPKMSENAKLLQKTRLFGKLSDQALIHLADHGEERVCRFGELLYREGDKQKTNWMAMVLSGRLSNQIHAPFGEKGTMPELRAGALFGELGALQVWEGRHSTVTALEDCKVLVIQTDRMWEAVRGAADDVQRIESECECWRAFMLSDIASRCPAEIAYHFREAASLRKLVPGEEQELGVRNQQRQLWAAAVIESGKACVKETGEVLRAKETSNVAAMLGIQSSETLLPEGGKPCNIAVLDRKDFWKIVHEYPQAREVYTKWALSQLPSATVDISCVPILQFLEGSQVFIRALAGSIRQRVVPPGMDAITAKDLFETLVFLQQGLADVVFKGHKVRELRAGQSVGELNLLSVQKMNGIVIVSSEFCVLQELKKQDVEMHLSKHPVARSRWRDLLKVRNIWKQDGSNDRQIDMLQESPFFNDEMPVGFAKAVHQSMEVRLFFPEEVVQDKDDPTDVLYLVCEGQMERMSNGKKSTLDVGGIWGEAGLLSDKDGPPETLVAKSVCGVMALHRRNMIDVFDSFPEAKAKIEAISRRSREGIFEAGGQSWNIYRMSCFKDCSSRFLYLLDLHLERHIYFSDETVVVENTEGEDMYILYSGAMEVKVKGITVGKLEGGMFFGEMAVLGLVKKRSATIIAKTLCDVRLLSRRSLEEALSEFPEEISRFEELAATRNRLSLEHRNGGRVRHLCSFFQDCNPKFATAIADDMQDKLFLSGQVLCREGLPQDSLFLIHQGTANVTVQQQRVSELKSGDICGELVALGLSPVTTATITAMDTCFVQELRSNVLMTVLDKFPEERQKLRQLAALRMEWRYALHDLQNFDWIRGTPAAFPTLLEQMITRWIFFRGDEMMVQGSPGDSLMMISSGSVEIVHDEQVIRELGGGDVLGELGALGIARLRTATVRCKDICDVYVLAKAALTRALSLHPEQMDPLRKLATARMRSDVERASEKHVLLNCPLFQQSSRKFLDRISEHLEDRLFMEGEDLCIEGEKGDTMFVLIQGTLNVFVKIDGKNKKVNELHKGSVIGEIAVLGLANHRTATLTAKTVCLVQILHRPILMKYLNEFPREIATFQEVGASRLTKSGISKNTLFPQQVLFRYCGSAFVEEVCKTLQRKICFPGQIIVEEGAESQEMYAIAQGHASVEKGGTLLGELQQGSAFGEKAVLGMMSIQLVSIKAESMCDLQYLNCHDLETMLANFTEEKKHLLQAVAGMMREEIAEITDHEILQEVPLLAVLGDDFTQHLLASLQVGAARRDEPVKSKSEELFVVILQGRASVQLDGSILRELSEGESFGEAACLGLAVPPKGDLAVELFVVGQSCLYLYATKDAVQRALQQEGAHMRDKLRGSVTMAPGFGRVVLESSPLSFLQMTQDQLTQLYDRCEEGFCLETQDLLSARHRHKTLLFLLAGKASCQVGDEELVLEPGSSLVQTSKDGPGRGPVTAIVHCKYLLLNKRVLLSVLKAQPEEERQRLLQRWEAMPGQAQKPASLRQTAERLCEQALQAAKKALVDDVKPWEKQKARFTLVENPPSVMKLQTGKRVSMKPSVRASTAVTPPRSESLERDRDRSAPASPARQRTAPKKINELDMQEMLFCKDMRRLTAMAKACAEDAMRELHQLHGQADSLRKQLKILSEEQKEDARQDASEAVLQAKMVRSRLPGSPRKQPLIR